MHLRRIRADLCNTHHSHLAAPPMAIPITMLHLWCYRYTSEIIRDNSIIQIWILHPNTWSITSISKLNQSSGSVHLLVMSSLPYLHINRPMTVIELSTIKIVCILIPVLVVWSLLSMDILYRQETLFLDAEQMTSLSCSPGFVLGRWGVVNIKRLWHLKIGRVIYEISQ